MRRIGRSTARTSTTSPTRDRDVLAAVDRDERLVGVDDAAAHDLRGLTTTERIADRYAAIGVTTRFRLTGSRIGPPAENE